MALPSSMEKRLKTLQKQREVQNLLEKTWGPNGNVEDRIGFCAANLALYDYEWDPVGNVLNDPAVDFIKVLKIFSYPENKKEGNFENWEERLQFSIDYVSACGYNVHYKNEKAPLTATAPAEHIITLEAPLDWTNVSVNIENLCNTIPKTVVDAEKLIDAKTLSAGYWKNTSSEVLVAAETINYYSWMKESLNEQEKFRNYINEALAQRISRSLADKIMKEALRNGDFVFKEAFDLSSGNMIFKAILNKDKK